MILRMMVMMVARQHQRKRIVVAGDGRNGPQSPDNLCLPPRPVFAYLYLYLFVFAFIFVPVFVLWVVSKVLSSDSLGFVNKWTFFWFS